MNEQETPLSLSAGEAHSVAVVECQRADGRTEKAAFAWGSMENGRLGYVNPERTSAPQEIRNVTSVLQKIKLRLVELSAGGAHTLGLTTGGGHIISWGAGTYGQLGSGNLWDRSSPVFCGGLRGVIAISAGYRHSLAIIGLKTPDGIQGKLWAWGANAWGEAGHGDDVIRLYPRPVRSLDGTVTSAISAGDRHSIVLTPGIVKKIRDDPEYKQYFELLHDGGMLVYNSLKKTMIKKGLNPAFLDTPDMITPGQPGLDNKTTELLYYEPGLRYCLDTVEPDAENRPYRQSYETAYVVPSLKLKHVCMSCARRCHLLRYTETRFRLFSHADGDAFCGKPSLRTPWTLSYSPLT